MSIISRIFHRMPHAILAALYILGTQIIKIIVSVVIGIMECVIFMFGVFSFYMRHDTNEKAWAAHVEALDKAKEKHEKKNS